MTLRVIRYKKAHLLNEQRRELKWDLLDVKSEMRRIVDEPESPT